MTHTESWRGVLADTVLSVTSVHGVERAWVVDALRRFFSIHADEDTVPEQPDIRLLLGRSLPPGIADEPCEEIPSGSALRVWQTTRGFRYTLGASTVDVDDHAGVAVAQLAADLWTGSPLAQRGLLLVTLLALLPAHRRYGLHASAVAACADRQGNAGGVLLVGAPGSGKTTLTLALVREGWQFVADDAIVLRPAAAGHVDALAVRRSLSCGLETARQFSELRAASDLDTPETDGKLLLDLDAIYPGRSCHACVPRLVIFPEIGQESQSTLLPLDQTHAFQLLLGQMSIATRNRARAADQLRTLRQLLAQTIWYRIQLGRDVHSDSRRVADLLGRALKMAAHGAAITGQPGW